jgi:predicted nucleic acid-binding protein
LIYLDSSVALAAVFAEDRRPYAAMWHQRLTSSRLLLYEVWTRINARGLQSEHSDAASILFSKIDLVELIPAALERALDPFPVAVRTLDALHLATIEYLRGRGHDIELASFDARLVAAARALGVTVLAL